MPVFTYRYFLHNFPDLCIFAVPDEGVDPIACVVCKIDCANDRINHNNRNAIDTNVERRLDDNKELTGYVAMLAVEKSHRRCGIGTALTTLAIRRMIMCGCTSVTLETEVSNEAAIKLYENRLGFIREELLVKYYLNRGNAYRLRLWLNNE